MKALLLLCILGVGEAFALTKASNPNPSSINIVVEVDKRAMAMAEELKASEKEFEDFKSKLEVDLAGLRDEDLRNEKKRQVTAIVEKNIEQKKNLCKSFPDVSEFCLKNSEIDRLRDQAESDKCKIDREGMPEQASSLASHDSDWAAMKGPKTCDKLIKASLPVVVNIIEQPKVEVTKIETKYDPAPSPKISSPKSQVVVVPKPSTPPNGDLKNKERFYASEDDENKNQDELSPRNYKPETCRWVDDLPRKIVFGPGCTAKGKSKICTGYVVCDQLAGDGKFIRMSSCSADKCGASDEDAVRCTKDQGYYSRKPVSEDKHFMSLKLKKILNGATEQ